MTRLLWQLVLLIWEISQFLIEVYVGLNMENNFKSKLHL